MKRTGMLGLTLIVFVIVVMLVGPILANPGGVGPGNKTIGCAGSSKHSAAGSAVISMEGSPLNPAAGQHVTVWVNVTSASAGTPLGVMIASSLSSTGNLADGWSVVTDPASTSFNYDQVSAASAGQNSFKWTLTAPTSGSHVLYSKAFYAGPSSTTYAQGLSFNVIGGGGSNTSVTIASPSAGSSVSGTVTVNANPINPAGISYAVLRIDGAVVSTLTAAPYAWTWNTSQYAVGAHVLNVTAAGADGSFAYAQVTVSVTNTTGQGLDQNAWQWTAIALLLSSIAAISLITVLILMFKKRRNGGAS
jgi:hypothetical protein